MKNFTKNIDSQNTLTTNIFLFILKIEIKGIVILLIKLHSEVKLEFIGGYNKWTHTI